MDTERVGAYIVNWLNRVLENSHQKGFVVGVSGGIDSAVVSTLCAETGMPLIVLNMPIRQAGDQYSRSQNHIHFLLNKYPNVNSYEVDLTESFNTLENALPRQVRTELSMANTRSRLRMSALYAVANANNYLVCGTGNKVEDFGIGFFTKYGDGGVDVSPIGDLYKSEVYSLGRHYGVSNEILVAAPTDGLWGVDRTDEMQIGASYDELEWAMQLCEKSNIHYLQEFSQWDTLSDRQKKVMEIYLTRHQSSLHKMQMPPVCSLIGIK